MTRTFLIQYRAKFKDHVEYVSAPSALLAIKKLMKAHKVSEIKILKLSMIR